ncbi:MAG: SAM-dependent methyltransferase [Alphaproteobacteria bacterium]|jgi:NADH dehydrogenase [ubiquinone] 1 alpha subcomplex assembly factor 7|nr:SAM-dependent methyltransferase [Candidatus Jidaibacter sp.]
MNIALKHVSSIIEHQGYITLYDFLKIVIPHYYSHNVAIGTSGDFTTAPEISQIFGETIAFFVLNQYQNLRLAQAALLELGPGKGTLMHDMLRVINNFQAFNIDRAYMLEISASLASIQKKRLSRFKQATWINKPTTINTENLFVIANEFFDALPIRQLEQTSDGCYEVVIVQNELSNLSLSKIKISNDQIFTQHGIHEISPDASHIIKQISNIKTANTFCIFIDYGYTTSLLTSTIQALYKHSHINFLDSIGKADITSLVDFGYLSTQFTQHGFKCEVLTQADFLKNNGIEIRAQQLIKHGADRDAIESALDRLISSQQMGELFKVLVAYRVQTS